MTTKPRYTVSDQQDADLEQEDIRDSRGRRITQEYVDAAVADVHEKIGRGRPSLTAAGHRSPQVTFRLPPSSATAPKPRPARRAPRSPTSPAAPSRNTSPATAPRRDQSTVALAVQERSARKASSSISSDAA